MGWYFILEVKETSPQRCNRYLNESFRHKLIFWFKWATNIMLFPLFTRSFPSIAFYELEENVNYNVFSRIFFGKNVSYKFKVKYKEWEYFPNNLRYVRYLSRILIPTFRNSFIFQLLIIKANFPYISPCTILTRSLDFQLTFITFI